jgi:hypothetical protein
MLNLKGKKEKIRHICEDWIRYIIKINNKEVIHMSILFAIPIALVIGSAIILTEK